MVWFSAMEMMAVCTRLSLRQCVLLGEAHPRPSKLQRAQAQAHHFTPQQSHPAAGGNHRRCRLLQHPAAARRRAAGPAAAAAARRGGGGGGRAHGRTIRRGLDAELVLEGAAALVLGPLLLVGLQVLLQQRRRFVGHERHCC